MDIRGAAPLLEVFGMPSSLRFYRDVPGFEVWASSEPGDNCNCNWCGLGLQRAELMLNTAHQAEHRPPVPIPRPHSPLTRTLACFSAPPRSRRESE